MERRAMRLADFQLSKHAAYFRKHMQVLHEQYKGMDTNRLTLLYFSVSGLDLLGQIDMVDKEAVIAYIYSLQSPRQDRGGFYGYPKTEFASEELDKCNNQPHITNTYVSLVMLLILGDDLGRVNREALVQSLKSWQLSDGSFCCITGISSLDSESDMRFVYCAASIMYILDLWHAVDLNGMFAFILASQSYDRAFGMGPLTESHGGCTYCALASLSMMGRLAELPGSEELIGWCAHRQIFGFQGRVDKPMDSCYSFWVGASLQLLGAGALLQSESCVEFLGQCEARGTGGFQKCPEASHADLLHSYFSICGLSLCGLLPPLNAKLGMSERAYAASSCQYRTSPGGQHWEPALKPQAVRHAEHHTPEAAVPMRSVFVNPWALKAAVLALLAVLIHWVMR